MDVEQDDIYPVFTKTAHRLERVGCGHDMKILKRQRLLERLANVQVIVHQQYAKPVCHGCLSESDAKIAAVGNPSGPKQPIVAQQVAFRPKWDKVLTAKCFSSLPN